MRPQYWPLFPCRNLDALPIRVYTDAAQPYSADLELYSFCLPCRYALNWVKLRVWEWQAEWDALLVLDADTTVTGDVVGRQRRALPCWHPVTCRVARTYGFAILVHSPQLRAVL